MKRFAPAAVLCVLTLAAAAPAQVAAPRGRIVVASEGFLGMQLQLLEPDGRALNQTQGIVLGLRGSAAVSPDGTSLIVVSTVRTGPGEDDANDTDLYRLGWISRGASLTTGTPNEVDPTWSPDGRRIAFAADGGGSWDLFVAPLDRVERGATNLTPGSAASDRRPRWSPDGRWIAFESDRGGDVDVYVVPADGSTPPRNVTGTPGADLLGDWAPDSTRLAFSSARSGGGDLYVLPVAGGAPVRVTTSAGNDSRPAWSPDGTTLAFTSDRDGDADVFTIRVDGTNERRLTRNVAEDVVLDWQPLHDTTRPVVRALASSGRRSRPLALRFRVAEDSGRVAVRASVDYAGGAYTVSGPAVPQAVARGRTYVVRFPQDRVAQRLPASFRFCIAVTDPSANESRASCARYRFVR